MTHSADRLRMLVLAVPLLFVLKLAVPIIDDSDFSGRTRWTDKDEVQGHGVFPLVIVECETLLNSHVMNSLDGTMLRKQYKSISPHFYSSSLQPSFRLRLSAVWHPVGMRAVFQPWQKSGLTTVTPVAVAELGLETRADPGLILETLDCTNAWMCCECLPAGCLLWRVSTM